MRILDLIGVPLCPELEEILQDIQESTDALEEDEEFIEVHETSAFNFELEEIITSD